MLTPGIHNAYACAVKKTQTQADVKAAARSAIGTGEHQAQTALFVTTAEAFRHNPELHEEIFDASSLVVRCPTIDTLLELVKSLEGQLTAALHIDEVPFLPALERRAGRIS